MKTRPDRTSNTSGALWIRGKKAAIFKKLLIEIASEVGGVVAARKYIPVSGKTYDLVNNYKVTAGTGRRILDAHKRLFKQI